MKCSSCSYNFDHEDCLCPDCASRRQRFRLFGSDIVDSTGAWLDLGIRVVACGKSGEVAMKYGAVGIAFDVDGDDFVSFLELAAAGGMKDGRFICVRKA